MPDLQIEGIGTIEVGAGFAKLSPEEQNAFVQNVIGQVQSDSEKLAEEGVATSDDTSFLEKIGRFGIPKGGTGILPAIGEAALEVGPGVGELFVGGVQRGAELLGKEDFSKRLGAEVAKGREGLTTAQKVGRTVGQVAATAPVGLGLGLLPGAAAGGATISALTPTEGGTLEEAGKQIAAGTATSVLTAGTLKGAIQVPAVTKFIAKRFGQKVAGVSKESKELIKAFDESGVNPTLADISQGQTTKTFQNLLGNFPGSRGVIEKSAQSQIDDVAKQLAGITKSTGGTVQQTGKTIQEGAKSAKRVIDARISKLYDDLDQFIPGGGKVRIPTENLKAVTQDPIIQDVVVVGAGDTSRILKRYAQIVDEGGNITYPRLKSFRSTVGAKLQSAALAGDERGALKKVYGALSEDMKAAVTSEGGEKGLQAFNKANSTFARLSKTLDTKVNPLIDAKTPEIVYNMALSGSKQGGTNIRAIMRGLDPAQKEFVRGTVAKRMGLATAGQQDAAGEVFSANRFLTEWNKLSPEARANIFTQDQRASIGSLNKVISSLKDTTKAAQTSNNLPYAAWAGIGGLTVASPVSAAGAVAGANLTSRLLTNPGFVKWLAQTPKIAEKEISKHLRVLPIIAANNPEIRQDVLDYMESITINNKIEE